MRASQTRPSHSPRAPPGNYTCGSILTTPVIWRSLDRRNRGQPREMSMLRSLLGVLAALFAVTAQAQPLDAATRRAAVDAAATQLRALYIFPEVGARAADRIEAQLAAGAYDPLSDPDAFAKRLTADLAEATHDKHLHVSPAEDFGPPTAAHAARMPHTQGGVVRADRLAGDIGYLELIGFVGPLTVFKSGVDPAMAALADARALIIDLRHNGGGDAGSVRYLTSFFLGGAKPVHIGDLIWRNPAAATFRTQEFWSVPTPTHYLGKPVLILTSHDTFSGAEGFTYDMQALKRGLVVGETTGGGAHPGHMIPLPGKLMVFMPIGRSSSQITHSNWEGTGVTPDVAAPADRALAVALERLGQTPAAGEVDALSPTPLFRPRAARQPGSDLALRRYVQTLAMGTPSTRLVTPEWSKESREDLAEEKAALAGLGPLRSVRFREVGPFGDNIYDLGFAHGQARWMVLLARDGRIDAAFPLM
ncbi:MAG: hypothetical protein E7812_08390 [Phenylobacterium sp.]|nr:MAG: hypothetical protein E7812_08390 [Phenylobacterium sp.]